MKELICKNCCHFRQHYALYEDKCVWVNCGHCVKRKGRSRQVWSKVCESFEPREEEVKLITKKFLSKRLLEYVLTLELPPEVTGEPPDEGRLEEIYDVSD